MGFNPENAGMCLVVLSENIIEPMYGKLFNTFYQQQMPYDRFWPKVSNTCSSIVGTAPAAASSICRTARMGNKHSSLQPRCVLPVKCRLFEWGSSAGAVPALPASLSQQQVNLIAVAAGHYNLSPALFALLMPGMKHWVAAIQDSGWGLQMFPVVNQFAGCAACRAVAHCWCTSILLAAG